MPQTIAPTNVLLREAFGLPTGTEFLPGSYGISPSGTVSLRTVAGGLIGVVAVDEAREALGLSSGSDPVTVSGWYGDVYFCWVGDRLRTSRIRLRDASGSYGVRLDAEIALRVANHLGISVDGDHRLACWLDATDEAGDRLLTEAQAREITAALNLAIEREGQRLLDEHRREFR